MIGERIPGCIRLAMAKKGMSGKELARKMQVTQATISSWRKRGCFDMGTAEKIAEHCDMTFDELMALAD